MPKAGMVRNVARNNKASAAVGSVIDLELALVNVRESGVEFLWNRPFEEWTELSVRMNADGRKDRFHARGLVVGCRPADHGLWTVSLYFTALAPGENPWPSA